MFTYKVQLILTLKPNNIPQRLRFSERALNELKSNPNFKGKIMVVSRRLILPYRPPMHQPAAHKIQYQSNQQGDVHWHTRTCHFDCDTDGVLSVERMERQSLCRQYPNN